MEATSVFQAESAYSVANHDGFGSGLGKLLAILHRGGAGKYVSTANRWPRVSAGSAASAIFGVCCVHHRGITIDPEAKMNRQVAVVIYVVLMAAIIVGVDFLFFRGRFWERLTVNIGIVLVFAAFYLRFLKRP
jgi:hypothetical protein